MHRRDALRAVTALAAGAVAAGCDSPSSVAQSPAPTAAGPASTGAAPLSGAAGSTSSAAGSTSSAAGPTSGAADPGLPDEIQHGPRDRPAVALTFHGQGEPGVVGRLLDAVGSPGVKITVLAVGTWLAAEPGLARRVLADGHELGNHTQHHADLKRMSAAEAHAEIADCARALTALTGSIGRWFRPSQTRLATPTIKAAAAEAGYPTCLSYDVDPLDYTDPGSARVVADTLRSVRPGSIISLHFGHPGTVAAIAPLLSGLHARGLTPVTMTELTAGWDGN